MDDENVIPEEEVKDVVLGFDDSKITELLDKISSDQNKLIEHFNPEYTEEELKVIEKEIEDEKIYKEKMGKVLDIFIEAEERRLEENEELMSNYELLVEDLNILKEENKVLSEDLNRSAQEVNSLREVIEAQNDSYLEAINQNVSETRDFGMFFVWFVFVVISAITARWLYKKVIMRAVNSFLKFRM